MLENSFNDCSHGAVIRLSDAKRTHPMSNLQHTVRDIHDILQSYYKVSRKRFVDNVVKQCTDHFLVTGPDTPLKFFSPRFVNELSSEDLQHVAGEAPRTTKERAQLSEEIASLKDARLILLRG